MLDKIGVVVVRVHRACPFMACCCYIEVNVVRNSETRNDSIRVHILAGCAWYVRGNAS